MTNISESLIFGGVLTSGFALLTLHILYQRSKGKPVMRKYEPGTQAYDICLKVYSIEFLIVSVISTLNSLLNLGRDIYVPIHGPLPLSAIMLFLAIICTSSVAVLYLLYKLFWKKWPVK